jgi:HAD superfamily hydrolase (TIGR01509 family)
MTDLFERKYFSYEVGMIKTDKNFLKLVLDDLNLSVEECILVGDSLQSDIQPAEKMGMKAVLVDRKESRAHSPSIKTLDELKTFL